jgi:hypothetical protein
MINWSTVSAATNRQRAYSDVRKILKPDNYGFGPGNWNMTDLIRDEDSRKFHAYQILDGVTAKHKRAPGLQPLQDVSGGPFLFKLRVLTRQACCRDKKGNIIWQSEQALEDMGSADDILPDYKEKPESGDVVEWKGQFREWDEDSDRKVTGHVLREWAARGIRPETYVEFTVDSDGCILEKRPGKKVWPTQID